MWSCVSCLICTSVLEEPSACIFGTYTNEMKAVGSIKRLTFVYKTMQYVPRRMCINSALISEQCDTLFGEFYQPVCILHLCRVESSVWSVALKWHCHVICVISWVIRWWPELTSLKKMWETYVEHKICCSFLCKLLLDDFPWDVCSVSYVVCEFNFM